MGAKSASFKIAVLLFILLASSNFWSQTSIKDEKARLATAKHDTVAFKALIELGWIYSETNIDSAVYFSKRAYALVPKLKNPDLKTNALELLANIQYRKGNFARALELYIQCLKIAEQTGNKIHQGYALLTVGNFLEELEDYENAVPYMRRADKVLQTIERQSDQVYALNRLGDIYSTLNKTDSALFFFQKSYSVSAKFKTPSSELAYAIYGLGRVNYQLKNPEIAKSYYLKGISLMSGKSSETDVFVLANCYQGLAEICKDNKDTEGAKSYYEKMLAANKSKDKLMLSACQNLAELTKFKDNDKAVSYFDQATKIRDSLYDAKTAKAAQRLIFKEHKREAERKQKELEELEAARNKLQYAGICLIIVCFIVMSIILSRSIIVNEKWIELLGVIGLLLMFEFINLLIHPYVGEFTHHSPIGMLLIMVAIAALLVPLHHKIEHWATHKMIEKNKKVRLAAAKKIIEKQEMESEAAQTGNNT